MSGALLYLYEGIGHWHVPYLLAFLYEHHYLFRARHTSRQKSFQGPSISFPRQALPRFLILSGTLLLFPVGEVPLASDSIISRYERRPFLFAPGCRLLFCEIPQFGNATWSTRGSVSSSIGLSRTVRAFLVIHCNFSNPVQLSIQDRREEEIRGFGVRAQLRMLQGFVNFCGCHTEVHFKNLDPFN